MSDSQIWGCSEEVGACVIGGEKGKNVSKVCKAMLIVYIICEE